MRLNPLKIITILSFALFCGCPNKKAISPNDNGNNNQPDTTTYGISVHFINLHGSIGDATLITTSSGYTMLIDAGDWGQGSGYVLPYLSSHKVRNLNFIVATHYHADHIGGFPCVLQQVPAGYAYDRGYSFDSDPFRLYIRWVNPIRHTIYRGDTLWLGADCYAACVAVNGNGVIPPSEFTNPACENDLSVALHIKFGKFDLFVGGDITGGGSETYDVESSFARDLGKIEVYKVSHHGSATSSNLYFLSITQPKVSVISVGNYQGLPNSDVLVRLRAKGDVYITRDDGDVVVTVQSTQSDSFTVKTSKGVKKSYQCYAN